MLDWLPGNYFLIQVDSKEYLEELQTALGAEDFEKVKERSLVVYFGQSGNEMRSFVA